MTTAVLAPEQPAEMGWIGGKRFDLFFFFGSALIAVAVGAFALTVRSAVVPLFWGFLLFIEGPHLVATWARTYLDAGERARRARLLVGSLAWLLPGIGVCIAAHQMNSRTPVDLFLLFATLWSFHHAIRQLHGILAIYHHHAQSAIKARTFDRYYLHGTLWLAFGLFSLGHPYNRSLFGFPRDFPPLISAMSTGLLVLLFVSVIGYALLRRLRFPKESTRPLIFLLGPAIGLQLYAMFVIGAFEPLVPRPEDPEQAFFTTTVVGGLVHGLNYLGIMIAVGRRRYEAREEKSIAAYLGRKPWIAYVVFVLVSLGYLAINAVRGVLPGVTIYERQSFVADLFLVIYWGVFFHHYYLDQHIWHVRSDEALRFELGLGANPQVSNAVLGRKNTVQGAPA